MTTATHYARAINRYAPHLDALGIDRDELMLELLYRSDGKGDGTPCGGGWISKRKKCSKKGAQKLAASLKAGDKGAIARVQAGKKKAGDRQSLGRAVIADKGKNARDIPAPPPAQTKVKPPAKTKKKSVGAATREETAKLVKNESDRDILTAIAVTPGGLSNKSQVLRQSGLLSIDFERKTIASDEVDRIVKGLRNDIYPDLENSQIQRKLRAMATKADKQRLQENIAMRDLGMNKEQAKSYVELREARR